MHEKTVRAMFMGHEIVAHNAFGATAAGIFCEAVLTFNGAIVDRTTEWSARKAKLCATLVDHNNRHLVEVVFGGIFTLRMKILVDGVKVAGDLR